MGIKKQEEAIKTIESKIPGFIKYLLEINSENNFELDYENNSKLRKILRSKFENEEDFNDALNVVKQIREKHLPQTV